MDDKEPLVQVRKAQNRLSESFPPDTQNNFEYIADVHKQLEKVDVQKIKNLSSKISFRSTIDEEDMEQIKKLHQEWFPLPYTESYYESILKGQVKSIIVEFEVQKNVKVIIGCLFYMSKVAKQRYLQFRYKYLLNDYHGIYITTIGVVNKFRSFGIASMMMSKLKQICRNSPFVQYIYLHIVTYNQSGIRYYERNGFIKVETKANHYDNIEGRSYDAFVYVCYENGSSKRKGCLNDIMACITTPIVSIVDFFKKKQIKQEEEDNINQYGNKDKIK